MPRATLKVPISASFRDLQDVEVRLLYDEPMEVDNEKYGGKQYLYGVEHGGEEKALYASPTLHEKMQEAGAARNAIVSIARVGEKRDTRWDVVLKKAGEPGGSPRAASGSSRPGGGSAGPQRGAGGFTQDAARYWRAFDYAMATLKERGVKPAVDANAVAFVFYKLLTDHGLDTFPGETAEEGDPSLDIDGDAPDDAKAKMRRELEALFLETGLDRGMWLPLLNALRSENERDYQVWDDVSRESGVAAYAHGSSVRSGDTTWKDVLASLDVAAEAELPF